MQSAAASINPNRRSKAASNMTPASLVMLPPSKRPSMTRRPRRPISIGFEVKPSVQFGIGVPCVIIGFDTFINAAYRRNADLDLNTTVKYSG
jgi:hypothetical protein